MATNRPGSELSLIDWLMAKNETPKWLPSSTVKAGRRLSMRSYTNRRWPDHGALLNHG